MDLPMLTYDPEKVTDRQAVVLEIDAAVEHIYTIDPIGYKMKISNLLHLVCVFSKFLPDSEPLHYKYLEALVRELMEYDGTTFPQQYIGARLMMIQSRAAKRKRADSASA